MAICIFRASLKAAGSELWVKSDAPVWEDPQGEGRKASSVLSGTAVTPQQRLK